jgi:succinoglycan biosynthesis transport protein ExoP
MQLKDIVAVAWKRRWLLLTVLAFTVGFASAFAFTKAKAYEATVTMAMLPDPKEGQGFIASDNLSALLSTYAATAESRSNLRQASAALGRPLPGKVDASTEAGTGILRLTGRADSPKDALITAQAAATAFQRRISTNELLIAEVVDSGSLPTAPVQPRPPLIIAAALILGLGGGLLLALALEHFRRFIETAEDFAEATSVPLLARLPRERALARGERGIAWNVRELQEYQESIRTLRTNLDFVTKGWTGSLQVTSPFSAEGKSTLTANLGVALAQMGVETVIVDADLRRPRQHELFGMPNLAGLTTVMRSGRKPEPVPTTYEHLSLMPAGPPLGDEIEQLHVQFGFVLREIVDQGAFVLVDTPPILPVSDARLVATHVSSVLLVVASGAERPSTLASALEKLQLAGATVAGGVLNMAPREREGVGYYGYESAEPTEAGSQLPVA